MRELLVCVVLVAAAIALVFFSAASLARYSCSYYERTTGIETKFDWIAGCYVRIGDKMIPYGEYKARAITNEEKQK